MAHPYWQYFLALESDLENTSRYVEIAKNNFDTYSIEYARILLSACSEIDVICKLICKSIDSTRTYKNINQYREIIIVKYSKLPTMEVLLHRYGFTLKPWEGWGNNDRPSWWKSYNAVKHERSTYYSEANLKNTLHAIAGLFCLVLYYYQKDARMGNLNPAPKILHLEEEPGLLALESGYGLPDFQIKQT